MQTQKPLMSEIPEMPRAVPDRPQILMSLHTAAERSYLLRAELHTRTYPSALATVASGLRMPGKRSGRPDAKDHSGPPDADGVSSEFSYHVAYAAGSGGRRWWYAPSSSADPFGELPGLVFPPPGDGRSGDYALCDGQRTWTVSPDQVVIEPAGPPSIPLGELLDPSWLLSRHTITVEDFEAVDGRPGVRIRAVPRRLPAAKPGDTDVVAVVDVEYGFLLRCQHNTNASRPRVTRELRAVLVDPDDAATFTTPTLPPGARVYDQIKPGWNRPASLSVRLVSAASLALRVLQAGPRSGRTLRRRRR
jgi:hypothetical protein